MDAALADDNGLGARAATIAVTMTMARRIIRTAMAIAGTTMIAMVAVIAAMTMVITGTADLDADALGRSRRRRDGDIEKASGSQQRKFLDHGFPSCEICSDKFIAEEKFPFDVKLSKHRCVIIAQAGGTSHDNTRFRGMNSTSKHREAEKPSRPDEKTSPAGTHDKPELTDKHKTPGSGMLPDDDHDEVEGPTG